MPRIVIHIMPKAEILDPQGKAITAALTRANYREFSAVRQGKRFELTLSGEANEAALTRARQAAEELLANPVIDDIISIEVLNDET